MIEDLTIRNYSPRTIEVYVDRVAKFARHFGQLPDKLGLDHMRGFQVFMVQTKKCSWAELNQTVCALRFFYRICLDQPWMIDHIPYARQPKKLPEVLSRDEVLLSFYLQPNDFTPSIRRSTPPALDSISIANLNSGSVQRVCIRHAIGLLRVKSGMPILALPIQSYSLDGRST